MSLLPVILSGGAGTRLWPLSRESYPKQFHALDGTDTLLQQTLCRLHGLEQEHPHQAMGVLPPLVVCNEAHRFIVAEQALEIALTLSGVLLEPIGRNTAPACTLAALLATRESHDPVLLVMPADHIVRDEPAFRAVVAQGYSWARQGQVVTFGIVPDKPETGYGYIRVGDRVDPGASAHYLQAFVEKPDLETARRYVDTGQYLWNSGLFMMQASRWLELVGQFRPDILQACRNAFAGLAQGVDFLRIDTRAFELCPSDSIDYAVMEHLAGDNGGALVMPLNAGWSDVGAWSALWEIREHDAADNALQGDVFIHQSRGNLIAAQHRMVAAVGVDNLVVVETPDAVLVMDRSRAQEVKAVTDYLKHQQRGECRFHRRVHRPWGEFEPILDGQRFKVKRLKVNPGAALSLQMHHHRAEHWVVVSGTAKVTCEGESFLLSENESTFIPLGRSHRLENPGRIPLEIIEVQSGSYLGEDDIQRFEDIYERSSADI